MLWWLSLVVVKWEGAGLHAAHPPRVCCLVQKIYLPFVKRGVIGADMSEKGEGPGATTAAALSPLQHCPPITFLIHLWQKGHFFDSFWIHTKPRLMTPYL